MTDRPGPTDVDAGRHTLRRGAVARSWIAAVLVALDLALVAIAGIAWSSVGFDEVVALTVLGASAAAGLPVLLVIAAANAAAARALRTGRPDPAVRRRATLGLTLALLRPVLLVAAVALIAARTDPAADGRWELDPAFLGFAAVDTLLALLLAATTKGNASRIDAATGA